MVLAKKPDADEVNDVRVRKAQAGDPRAFAELVELHQRDVARVALRIVRNSDDAQDVAQDAWVRVAAHLDTLRDASLFQAWLRRIARNTSLDFVSRKRCPEAPRYVHEGDDEPLDLLASVADDDPETPEGSLLSHDEQRKVWEALGRLSETDRAILHLREHQGLAYAEIARRLNIERNAAEVRVFRAKERFRTHYTLVDSHASCVVSAVEIGSFVAGELRDEARDRVQGHLFACTDCRERMRAMRTGRRLYRAIAGPGLLGPGAALGGLMAQAQALFSKALSLMGLGSSAAVAPVAAGTTTGVLSLGAAASGTTAAVIVAAAIAGSVIADHPTADATLRAPASIAITQTHRGESAGEQIGLTPPPAAVDRSPSPASSSSETRRPAGEPRPAPTHPLTVVSAAARVSEAAVDGGLPALAQPVAPVAFAAPATASSSSGNAEQSTSSGTGGGSPTGDSSSGSSGRGDAGGSTGGGSASGPSNGGGNGGGHFEGASNGGGNAGGNSGHAGGPSSAGGNAGGNSGAGGSSSAGGNAGGNSGAGGSSNGGSNAGGNSGSAGGPPSGGGNAGGNSGHAGGPPSGSGAGSGGGPAATGPSSGGSANAGGGAGNGGASAGGGPSNGGGHGAGSSSGNGGGSATGGGHGGGQSGGHR